MSQYVFCEKTAIALELYGEKHGKDVLGTVTFLRIVCQWWKILNVKRKGVDVRRKDPIQAVVSNSGDQRLDWIQSFGVMCGAMAGKQGNRVRQLSKDTARAIHIILAWV